jgi:eukaryotic-like serine/threonine-protein kinase
MALMAGARVGPYEIVSIIGVGGMGEVYKARDSRLDRIIAIKLLPADVAGRVDRRARFEKEARAISSLSHPHICTLYDIGDDGGRPFIVMEYLEGETLDDRLTRGPLPAVEVIRYAVQIADALAHAHHAHIVHRDLKPSNVMLTSSGAKLLDFGLARRDEVERVGVGTAAMSFRERTLTEEGTILGTFQYMAPEQLQGKNADVRTDVFAFGTVLYEMATGRKTFDAPTPAGLMAAILTEEPPLPSVVRAGGTLPPALDHVVERCLAKDPDDRWQTARDLQRELEWIAGSGSLLIHTWNRAASWRQSRLLVTASLVVLAVAATTAILRLRPASEPSREVTRFIVTPPSGSIIPFGEQRTRLALSPNGRTLAFVAFNQGQLQIWVQPLDSLVARPLPGTEGAVSPFWSPDNRYVGYFTPVTGELKKVDVSGGPPQTICAAAAEGVAEWGSDGTILFSVFRSGIFRVSGEGGTAVRVTSLDKARRELNHYWPSFLPDGRHFLYLATAKASDTTKAIPSVYVAALDGTERTLLDRIHSRVVYAAPGYLLFQDQGTLLAQSFDLASRHVVGQAVPIADGIAALRTLGTAHFSVSATNALAYLGSGDSFEMIWYDRRGNPTSPGWAKQWYGEPRLSPDTRRAVVDVFDPRSGTADLWIYDLERNVPTRFTSESPTDKNAVWSPRSEGILYSTEQGGSPNIYFRRFDGSGELKAMVVNPEPVFADDWSPDGNWIAYTATTTKSGQDLWLKPLTGDGKERVFLNTRFDEESARFSPDSRWLAYSSNESSSIPEIYVARVDQPGERVRISTGGGTGPRWRRDGKELFYAAADGRTIMSVPIDSLAPFRAGTPTRLFTLGFDSAVTRTRVRNTIYDVSPDGQRFLVSVPVGQPASSQITVVLNWPAILRSTVKE